MKLFKNIIKGDRLSLAKGITLIESDLDLDVKNLKNSLVNAFLTVEIV